MRTFRLTKLSLALTGLIALPTMAYAQGGTEEVLEEVIVTGVVKPATRLDSTGSVTALSATEVLEFAPRSTAEIFRNIPGVQSESSSGDSNANIKVRGLPISAGGARYLSLQEDGLPVLLIGDLEFGTSDSFLRFDYGVDSVQAIRGGTASTQATNSPGGIINLISDYGDQEGGSIGYTTGLDYKSDRIDFRYGKPLDGGWQVATSGYYRDGEGPRDAPGDLESGYQIKANVTKTLENGFFRVSLKQLDDSSPTYLPIPARYTGNGGYEEVGVDFGDGTLILQGQDPIVREGGLETNSLNGGFQAESRAIGLQGEFDVSDTSTFAFNHRSAQTSGSFVSPFPAQPYDGVDGPSVRIHYFNTKLDSLDNAFTDLNYRVEFGNTFIKAGLFRGYQEYVAQWGWNTYFAALDGGLTPTTGPDGEASFLPGHPLWGNCCQRSYDIDAETIAPYIAAAGDIGDFSWDASLRQDNWTYDGNFAFSNGTNAAGFPVYGPASRVDAEFDYLSYSFGGNWSINDSMAVFANYSEGGSAFAPSRVTGSLNATTGDFDDQEQGYGQVTQAEIGFKYQGDIASVYVTYFDAETIEPGAFEVTTQNLLENTYDSSGFEIEGDIDFGSNFGLKGSITFTDAEITDSSNPDVIGNDPRRQADRFFNITPYYNGGNVNAGLNFVGTSDVFVQDDNNAKFDGYIVTNLFATYQIMDNASVSLNVNNLLDEEGFTEGENGNPAVGDYVQIRPINGRTMSLSLRYDF